MFTDILILLFLLFSLLRGREIGLARQAGSTLGFVGGVFLGAWLQPHLIGLAHSTLSRAMTTLCVVLGSALLCLGIGEYIGLRIKEVLLRSKIDMVDSWLGAGAGIVAVLVTVWLAAPTLMALPFPSLQQSLRSSRIVTELSTALPAAPAVISRLEHLIDPNGFPKVFVGLEPEPTKDAPLPDLGSLNGAVTSARPSVVKIEGQGCGGIVEGSGFVAKDVSGTEYVVTNAHVVAGIAHPYVIDQSGGHTSQTVWFDPDLDVAVLRTTQLVGKPLTINVAQAAHGTPGVVLGYPGGGDFTAKAASVLQSFTANGRNIYDEGTTTRRVYELKADIIQGNSGGPVVNASGEVIGLVFAQSTAYDQVGYALQMQAVQTELSQAVTRNSVVSSGQCAE